MAAEPPSPSPPPTSASALRFLPQESSGGSESSRFQGQSRGGKTPSQVDGTLGQYYIDIQVTRYLGHAFTYQYMAVAHGWRGWPLLPTVSWSSRWVMNGTPDTPCIGPVSFLFGVHVGWSITTLGFWMFMVPITWQLGCFFWGVNGGNLFLTWSVCFIWGGVVGESFERAPGELEFGTEVDVDFCLRRA